ncbi:MAG: hypothetical protein Q4B64_01640 [Spirochaetales bacterium]|nr:hypothetical protein [Spirochaetales bacterium]
MNKKNIKESIFYFSQETHWFDGQGEDSCSFEIFNDGSVSYNDFADERVPGEIEKDWGPNEKLYSEVVQVLYRVSEILNEYESGTNNYEEYETCDKPEAMRDIANLIEEFYRFDFFERPKGINFSYKWNNISSEYFCKKAPFTLVVKEIMEIIKLYHEDFEIIKLQ